MIVTRTRFPSDRNSLRCWFFTVRSPTSMRSRYFISFISTVTCFFLASFCRFICSYWYFPKVHDLANGRSGVGRHDDQVESLRVRKFKSCFGRQQAQLAIVVVNDADFLPAHSLVVNQI